MHYGPGLKKSPTASHGVALVTGFQVNKRRNKTTSRFRGGFPNRNIFYENEGKLSSPYLDNI